MKIIVNFTFFAYFIFMPVLLQPSAYASFDIAFESVGSVPLQTTNNYGKKTYRLLMTDKEAKLYTAAMANKAASRDEEPDFNKISQMLSAKLSDYLDKKGVQSPSDLLKILIAYSAAFSANYQLAYVAGGNSAYQHDRVMAYNAAKRSGKNSAWNRASTYLMLTLRKASDGEKYYEAFDASYKRSLSYNQRLHTEEAAFYAASSLVQWWHFLPPINLGEKSYRQAERVALASLSSNLEKNLDTCVELLKSIDLEVETAELQACSETLAKHENKTIAVLFTPIIDSLRKYFDSSE